MLSDSFKTEFGVSSAFYIIGANGYRHSPFISRRLLRPKKYCLQTPKIRINLANVSVNRLGLLRFHLLSTKVCSDDRARIFEQIDVKEFKVESHTLSSIVLDFNADHLKNKYEGTDTFYFIFILWLDDIKPIIEPRELLRNIFKGIHAGQRSPYPYSILELLPKYMFTPETSSWRILCTQEYSPTTASNSNTQNSQILAQQNNNNHRVQPLSSETGRVINLQKEKSLSELPPPTLSEFRSVCCPVSATPQQITLRNTDILADIRLRKQSTVSAEDIRLTVSISYLYFRSPNKHPSETRDDLQRRVFFHYIFPSSGTSDMRTDIGPDAMRMARAPPIDPDFSESTMETDFLIEIREGLSCPWCDDHVGDPLICRSVVSRSNRRNRVSKKRLRAEQGIDHQNGTNPRAGHTRGARRGGKGRSTGGGRWTVRAGLGASSLLIHLQSFHPLFECHPRRDPDGNLHILVRRSEDDSEAEPSQLSKPTSQSQGLQQLVWKPFSHRSRRGRDDLWSQSIPLLHPHELSTAAINGKPVEDIVETTSDGYAESVTPSEVPDWWCQDSLSEDREEGNPYIRHYYHAHLGRIVPVEEMLAGQGVRTADTDGDVSTSSSAAVVNAGTTVNDETDRTEDSQAQIHWARKSSSSWLVKHYENMLDDYVDIALEEKEFMKEWNRYITKHPVLAKAAVPETCRSFALSNAKMIIENRFRYHFLLHLINLWDFGLLSKADILSSLGSVDEEMASRVLALND